jgi:inosine-uridine nucleoside N-ribohydrolase
LTTVSQNNQTINTYGDTEGAAIQTSPVQHSSEMNFEAAPVSHNIQAPAAVPVKVMPVEAQPDVIIQPAHAAELTSTAGLSPEAANVANGLAQSHKGGMVDTNVASDLMTFLNKRR